MTSITLELEERHEKLKAEELFSKFSDNTDFCKEYTERRFARNYGFYNSTRYSARVVGLGLGAYFIEDISFERLWVFYALTTMLLLVFIFIFFRELRVSLDNQKIVKTKRPGFCALLAEHFETCFTHPKHWGIQIFGMLTCMVPVFGLESHFVKLLAKNSKDHNIFSAENSTIATWYICAGVIIFLIVQIVLRWCRERTARFLFVLMFFASSYSANCLVYAASHSSKFQEGLYFTAIAVMNLSNCVISIALVSSFFESSPLTTGCFSINLVNSLYNSAIIISRLFLVLENSLTNGGIDDLNLERFQSCAVANIIGSLAAAIFLFKVKI